MLVTDSSANMAELRYEAPLATFDMDEWNDFMDLQTPENDSEDIDSGTSSLSKSSSSLGASNTLDSSQSGMDGFDDESFSGSLEDLVNTFDERITKCFKNYNDRVETFAPVQVRTDEEIIAASETQNWWTLTGNYGNILPINWNSAAQIDNNLSEATPATRNSSNNKSSSDAFNESDDEITNICDENDNNADDDDDDDDDDDISTDDDDDDDVASSGDTIDMEDPVISADQVITELEYMLDGSPRKLRKAGGARALSSSVSEELRLYAQSLLSQDCSLEDEASGLERLSVRALRELKQELDACIREHSEILVDELALRDDLEYEKELKNQFIWLLLTVQKRRKEASNTTQSQLTQPVNHKQRGHGGINGNGYLTTVIPYQSTHGPPAIERLQIYIRLLSAINDNSHQVPTLLTDYILKVLCPTS